MRYIISNFYKHIFILYLSLNSCLHINANPQLNYASDELVFEDSIMVSPVDIFKNKAGSLFSCAMYTPSWNQPVKIKILNIKKSFEGLTPKSTGQKRKTNLKLEAKDGRIFKFKILKNKIPPMKLPDHIRKLLQKTYLNGRYSMAFPYPHTVVSKLSEALGLLHEHPVLCCLPDDKNLGEFRSNFALKPGYLMIHLKQKNKFISVKHKVIKAYQLYDDPEIRKKLHKVIPRLHKEQFLLLRFLSILIGDFDRHDGQLKWIHIEKENRWYPFPTDRDMAFFSMKGTIAGLVINKNVNIEKSKFYKGVFSFTENDVNIKGLIDAGKYLDRRILFNVPKKKWVKLTKKFKSLLNDEVIENAVKAIPEEVDPSIRNKILVTLKQRRDNFSIYVEKYYNYLNDY